MIDKPITHIFVGLFLLFILLPANAVIETYEFDNDTLRERYHRFSDELRCPKCQNQNLTGSNSPIAKDLRRELHRLLQEGENDQQIVDYMVARYGDFILYRPRFTAQTALLWIAPIIFLALGVMILVMILIRQRGKRTVGETEVELALDVTEREQLNLILREEKSTGVKKNG
ncbi:MAG: cytochrome c-type biogenesis protein CcmH [Spongiibacteraceae bacterium]|nr:cytochrome c-type biogenesis protein CcmH [Spongiibacteraceae bacterium]